MKAIFLISLLIASPALAGASQITATVNGMVCGFCAQGITKKFNAEPAVKSVDVSLEKKSVKIDLKEGKDLDDKTIEKILKDSGYNVEKITRI
jgi:copper chaperone CopZ